MEDAPEITEAAVENIAAEPALLRIPPYRGKECAVLEEVTP